MKTWSIAHASPQRSPPARSPLRPPRHRPAHVRRLRRPKPRKRFRGPMTLVDSGPPMGTQERRGPLGPGSPDRGIGEPDRERSPGTTREPRPVRGGRAPTA